MREVAPHRQNPVDEDGFHKEIPEPNYMGNAYKFEMAFVLRAVLQDTGTLSACMSSSLSESDD